MKAPDHERHWGWLLRAANEEVERVMASLPGPVRREAKRIPVTFEPRPNREMVRDGLADDLLGLFVGESYSDAFRTDAALPAQIILFLDNLWDYAEEDAGFFREEVRRTYLHELGHYLGLDEEGLADRDLD